VIFLFISPLSYKGWRQRKKNLHPLLLMVEIFLLKSLGRKDAHLKKCSREYLMQTSELVVHSTTLYEAEAG